MTSNKIMSCNLFSASSETFKKLLKQVLCRIRPLNESEKRNGSQKVTQCKNKDTIILPGNKQFVFDHVFDETSSQQSVYEGAAQQIVLDVLSGYNGTVFAYGQTSSGKTHTMEGSIEDSEKQGIIPRIIDDIFNRIYNMDDESLQFHIKVSYFEIYNEKIRDLLDVTKMNLPIHEDKNRVPYVKGITEQFVSNAAEILDAIKEGKNNRQVAVTNMNEHSSRSHSVFLIQIEQENKTTQKKLTGKLYLVDLAGSEKVSKTGAEGAVLEEAKNINKSLSALGNVISALAEGTKSHVPYRDSKLTRILQESLGGNSRTTIVICCSPASYNEQETKSTLMFGQRAKTIKNVVVVNEELTAEEWKRRYEREKEKVARLRMQLQNIQNVETEIKRWRSGERVPELEWSNISDISSTAAASLVDSALTPSMSDSMFTSLDRSVANQQPLLSSNIGPITDEERRRYEDERSKLYQQLDEKDDEIQAQSQLAERAKQQLVHQEETIKACKAEYESTMEKLQLAQEQNNKNKEETEEMFAAIQELAINLDQKKNDCKQLEVENEQLQEDIQKKSLEIVSLTSKVDEINETYSSQKRRVYENIQNMLRDMAEIGETYVSDKFTADAALDIDKSDKAFDVELLAHARICISKLSNDFKTAQQKLMLLESGSGDAEKRLDALSNELAECRLQLQQVEVKNKSLEETIDSQEKAKRQLEDDLDALNAKLANSAPQAVGGGASEDAQQQQQKLVAQLRDQIALKNSEIKQLTESLQELQVVKEKLAHDYEKLKNDELEKERKYKDLSALSDKREQAKQDLKGLEETVNKEIQSLHNLRKIFVQDLAQRMKKAPTGPEAEDEFLSSPIQRQKIIFLENNLEQLTAVHKQLVRDNADLRCELPKLEKRYRASLERIKNLEAALRDTKENAMRDRKQYQSQVERIKEAVRQRNLARIAKPIRPKQHYPTNATPIRPGNAAIAQQ